MSQSIEVHENKSHRFEVVKVKSEVAPNDHQKPKNETKGEKKSEPLITDKLLDQIGSGILEFVNQQVNGIDYT